MIAPIGKKATSNTLYTLDKPSHPSFSSKLSKEILIQTAIKMSATIIGTASMILLSVFMEKKSSMASIPPKIAIRVIIINIAGIGNKIIAFTSF